MKIKYSGRIQICILSLLILLVSLVAVLVVEFYHLEETTALKGIIGFIFSYLVSAVFRELRHNNFQIKKIFPKIKRRKPE